MNLLHPHGHHMLLEEPSDEIAELHHQRRSLRLVCDEQRRELIRLERELDRLRAENAHLHRRINARRWWQR